MFCKVIVTKLVVIFLRNTYGEVYQEEFFNKTDTFSERLQQRLMMKLKDTIGFVLLEVIILIHSKHQPKCTSETTTPKMFSLGFIKSTEPLKNQPLTT